MMRHSTTDERLDLEHIFEIYPYLLFVVGYDGYIKKINPAVSLLLGYSESDLHQAVIEEFLHPADRARSLGIRQKQVNGEFFVEYEARCMTKDGEVLELSWTSILVERDKFIFAIARNSPDKHSISEDEQLARILERLNQEQQKRFSMEIVQVRSHANGQGISSEWLGVSNKLSALDQRWLTKFESLVRENAKRTNLNLKLLSREMATSERQLYRQMNRIISMTPKKVVRLIRFHLVWEMIASGLESNVPALSRIAGYASASHFRKMFKQIYGIEVDELL